MDLAASMTDSQKYRPLIIFFFSFYHLFFFFTPLH